MEWNYLSGDKSPIIVGNTLPLANIPLGTLIHNIELKPAQGGILVRSAGSLCTTNGKRG